MHFGLSLQFENWSTEQGEESVNNPRCILMLLVYFNTKFRFSSSLTAISKQAVLFALCLLSVFPADFMFLCFSWLKQPHLIPHAVKWSYLRRCRTAAAWGWEWVFEWSQALLKQHLLLRGTGVARLCHYAAFCWLLGLLMLCMLPSSTERVCGTVIYKSYLEIATWNIYMLVFSMCGCIYKTAR